MTYPVLRSRRQRRQDLLATHLPDTVIIPEGTSNQSKSLTGGLVGLALLVMLDSLTPAERLAFVLHDMFERSTKSPHRRAHPNRRAATRQPIRDPDRVRRIAATVFPGQ